jgi:hypothetical protein
MGQSANNNDVTYVSTVNDLIALKGVVNLNGSLFIHSGYDITANDLCLLESVEQIEGYLVVWKSPGIRSLKCFNNIKAINGKGLHTGNPPNSVFMEDNVNQTTGVGLCFVNTIDWTLLTSEHISISDNGVDCPSCNSECSTCWGAGPRLCQTCINYKSGVTCVSKCPDGTILDNVTMMCQEFRPQVDSVSFMNVSQQLVNDNVHVTLDWSRLLNVSNDPSVILNGVPLGYRLWLDGDLIFEEKYHDFRHNGNDRVDYNYDEINDGLTEEFLPLSERLVLNTSQSYRIKFQVLNTIGWSPMSPSVNLTTMDGIPMPVQNLSVTSDDTNVTVSWLPPSTTNGKLVGFHVNLFQRNGTVWSMIYSVNLPYDSLSHTISLENSAEYSVCITALNHNWDSVPMCGVFQVPDVTITATTRSPYTGSPTAVTDLRVDIVNSTTVVVSWNSLSDDHQVTLSNSTYSYTHVMSKTSMVFDNLKPFTFYTVEIVAFDQFGYSPLVSTNWTTPYSNPPVPDAPYLYEEKLHDIWIWLKPVSDEFGYVDNYTLHVNATCNDDESYPIPRLAVVTVVKLSDYIDVYDHHVYTFRLESHIGVLSSISAYSDKMTSLQTYDDTGISTWTIWFIVVVSITCVFFVTSIILLIILIRRCRKDNVSIADSQGELVETEKGTDTSTFTNPIYGVLVKGNLGTDYMDTAFPYVDNNSLSYPNDGYAHLQRGV